MAQTSFLLFMSVIVAMAVCMAWRVADDELAERLVRCQSFFPRKKLKGKIPKWTVQGVFSKF